MLIGPNGVIAFAGGLGIPVGTGLLALTALPGAAPHAQRQAAARAPGLARRGSCSRSPRSALAFPTLVPKVPTAGSDAAYALLACGLSFCVLLTHRATRTFWLTRRPADLLVAVGCIWLGVALFAQLVIGPMTLGYYLGHGLELAAVALIAIPAARDIARTGASFPLVGDLTATDLVASEEAYLGPRVRALMIRLAERDGSTEEHTRRVAILAAQVGEELKLPATDAPPPGRRRAAARHRQALGAAGDPAQAERADRRGVRGDQAPPRGRPAPAATSSAASPPWSATSSPTTTSASTAAATRAG